MIDITTSSFSVTVSFSISLWQKNDCKPGSLILKQINFNELKSRKGQTYHRSLQIILTQLTFELSFLYSIVQTYNEVYKTNWLAVDETKCS